MIKQCIKQTVLAVVLSAFALAGGSISWVDAKEEIKKDDAHCLKMLEKHFSVAAQGEAIRLGRHAGEDAGKRVPPYTFKVTRKRDGKKFEAEIFPSPDYDYTKRFTFELKEVTG